MAPIKESLERITTGKNDAILITDFEEYSPDGKEELYAYAKDSFLEWIKAGNKITFFYNKYHEVNKKTRKLIKINCRFGLFKSCMHFTI